MTARTLAGSLEPATFLTPRRMDCARCDTTEGIAFPSMRDGGHYWCPNCSPAWFGDFLLFRLEMERDEQGLTALEPGVVSAGLLLEEVEV